MNVDKRLRNNLSQPDEQRRGRLINVVPNPLCGTQIRLLKHIFRVDASQQSSVHAKSDHAVQPFAMSRKFVRQRIRITFLEAQ